ncbi:MAG: lytic transglycosylase domain-containing protein [Firmicutes bacterium]|nr:lytic transglycosylase domain-containing protein [Bacillota bacterium]
MKKLKALAVIIILLALAFLWFEWFYPGRMQHLLFPLEYKDSIKKASKRYGLDPYVISAIIYEESKFNPSSESRHGAIGLMQVMPKTGKWVAAKQGRQFSVDDLYTPETNIDMGCFYYNYLLSKYGDERLALAAYNSGFKNVDRWLRDRGYASVDAVIENIPYEETRQFVQRVQRTKTVYKRLYPGAFKEVERKQNSGQLADPNHSREK